MIINHMGFKNHKIKKLSLITITYHIINLYKILKTIKQHKSIINKKKICYNSNEKNKYKRTKQQRKKELEQLLPLEEIETFNK